MTRLADDPRWRRLHDSTWACPCCGETHSGLFDLAFDRPRYFDVDEPVIANGSIDGRERFVAEDFAVLDGAHYFVRGVLGLPVVGSDETFGIGLWSTLSDVNFAVYRDTFGADQTGLGPWTGWIANAPPTFADTKGLACRVRLGARGARPTIELPDSDHELATAQRDGIAFDRVLAVYAAAGHDLRPHLTD